MTATCGSTRSTPATGTCGRRSRSPTSITASYGSSGFLDGRADDAMAFFEFADGLITRVTDFWPEPYEPPPGREHLVERWLPAPRGNSLRSLRIGFSAEKAPAAPSSGCSHVVSISRG